MGGGNSRRRRSGKLDKPASNSKPPADLLARAYLETRLGFGKLGMIHLPERANDWLVKDPHVIQAISKRLDDCLARGRALVAENKDAVIALAEALGARGYLDRVEIETLLGQHARQRMEHP